MAHAVPYAKGINELRWFIFNRYSVPLPPVYAKFMVWKPAQEPSKMARRLSLLIAVSAIQLFTATINSLVWGVGIGHTYYTNTGNDTLLTIILPGIVTFFITSIIFAGSSTRFRSTASISLTATTAPKSAHREKIQNC